MRNRVYSGALTAEQFLFYEIRIAAGYYMNGDSLQQAAEQIAEGNLFQYPTLREEVKRMTKACYRRLDALGDQELVSELRSAPADIARQINLYAMMRDNLLVWEFMVQLIGEKYRMQDFHLDRKDINGFFSRLQAQSDQIAGWSDSTIDKIRGVLLRSLVETEQLDSTRSTSLHPILISEELKTGMMRNGDREALVAFNCFG